MTAKYRQGWWLVLLIGAGCGHSAATNTPAGPVVAEAATGATSERAADVEPASAPDGASTAEPASFAQPAAAPDEKTQQDKPTENDMASGKEKTESVGKPDVVVRSEAEWQKLLTPEQYHVLREKGTERPFTNKYDHHFEPGTYACAACGQELFDSKTKFNSGCGWPAFYAAQAGDRVRLTPDSTHGMSRTEVTCARCGSHLGHIFDDAPQTPTGQRYCINSVSLEFRPVAGGDKPAEPQGK